jgi:hypothetical protein
VWHVLYWPVIWLTLASMLVHGVQLVAPRRPRLGHGLDIVTHAGLAVMAAYALSAGHWAVVTGVDIAPSALAQVDKGVNVGIQVALIVVIVASVGSILHDMWRIFRPEPSTAPPSA